MQKKTVMCKRFQYFLRFFTVFFFKTLFFVLLNSFIFCCFYFKHVIDVFLKYIIIKKFNYCICDPVEKLLSSSLTGFYFL